MKKLITITAMALLLSSCVTTIQVACNTPGIEIFINDNSFGESPATITVKKTTPYVYVSCKRQGMELHAQRVYLQNKQNYYEVEIPKNLHNSSNPNHYLKSTSY